MSVSYLPEWDAKKNKDRASNVLLGKRVQKVKRMRWAFELFLLGRLGVLTLTSLGWRFERCRRQVAEPPEGESSGTGAGRKCR